MTAVLRRPGALAGSGTARATPEMSAPDASNVGQLLLERRLVRLPGRRDRLLADRASALVNDHVDIPEKSRTTP
jgi:hypothetical protein